MKMINRVKIFLMLDLLIIGKLIKLCLKMV